MQVIVAKNSGFCFGVRRAVDMAKRTAEEKGKIYTLGELIHNQTVISELKKEGIIPVDSLESLSAGATLVIRSHGVGPEVYDLCDTKGIIYVDCTCPFVKRIHSIVAQKYKKGYSIIVVGDKKHPEVIGINGYCNGDAVFISALKDVADAVAIVNSPEKVCLVSQTTFDNAEFAAIVKQVEAEIPHIEVFNTICATTNDRQVEAYELSGKCDAMLVLGDHHSSNTAKLANICKKNCDLVKSIAKISELPLDIIETNGIIVGVVAGASTPDSLIREVVTRMSELDKAKKATEPAVDVKAAATEPVIDEGETTFEEAFEKTLVRIRNGQILTGSVVQIVDGEVCVNIGYKSDGFIPRDEFSYDPDIDPSTAVAVGDKIEVEVLKVNDGEGNVLLSRKNVESKKLWEEFSADAESEGKILEGVGKEVVKGGIIATLNGGIRAFVPASQLSTKFIENLNDFVGKPIKVKIIEVDKQRKRVVASHRAVLVAEAEEAKRKIWEKIVVGSKVTGTVRRLTVFGAFVDIGGVDGLVHITDAAWGHIKHPNEVLKVGQQIEVLILNVDPDKKRISLGYKQLQPKPWTMASERYPVGSIIEGKVVRIVPFGAFVALEPTIDGLVHISHIGVRRVSKVEDELSVGDVVRCKIVEVNPEQKRISLSRKDAILEENPEIAEEIMREKQEQRERAAAERAERRAAEEQARQQAAQQREERQQQRRERNEQRAERSERPERRRREDADYELPPVQTSTTSLAALFGNFSAGTEEN